MRSIYDFHINRSSNKCSRSHHRSQPLLVVKNLHIGLVCAYFLRQTNNLFTISMGLVMLIRRCNFTFIKRWMGSHNWAYLDVQGMNRTIENRIQRSFKAHHKQKFEEKVSDPCFKLSRRMMRSFAMNGLQVSNKLGFYIIFVFQF